MLEGLVAWVLNNYLGQYVENLNTDQLSVALLSGKVELENLPLKKDALRHLGLSVEVKAGFIGKVQLQVPVRQIRSAPWVIAIDKLYLVAAPINLDEWDGSMEALSVFERKVSVLDAMEAQWRAEHEAADAGYYATSYSSWLSYGTGLFANIVENLQLKLTDVHIRYEDSLTTPSGFALGLTLGSLVAESCDSEWVRGFTPLADPEGCSYKLMELTQLALYWDHMSVPNEMMANCTMQDFMERMSEYGSGPRRFVVRPTGAQARVRRERSAHPLRSRTRPRLQAHLTLHTVDMHLTDRQYGEAVGCWAGLARLSRLRVARAGRPAAPVRGHARDWWIYALKAHSPHYLWTEPKPTWESCLSACRNTCRYVTICVQALANPAGTLAPNDKRAKDDYEWATDLDVLKALREVAMRKVPVASPTASPAKPSSRSMLVHWFPQWWGWYDAAPAGAPPGAPTGAPSTAPPAPPLEEEILGAIADSIENNTVLKRDTVFGKFEFLLTKGYLNVCTESEAMESESGSPVGTGASLQFSLVRVSVESRPRAGSHALLVSLGAVCLRERITPHTLFPVLVAPQGMIRSGLATAAASSVPWCRAHAQPAPPPPQDPLFQLSYEKKPFGLNCDYKLWVKSASLEVVYSSAAVSWAQQFIRAPWERLAGPAEQPGAPLQPGQPGQPGAPLQPGQPALPAYRHVRDSTRQHLKSQWEHMMHPHPGDRQSWHVELDISAPQILFVEELSDRDAAVLVVDFGRLRLANAALVAEPTTPATDGDEDEEEMFMTPCSTPPGSLLSPASPPRAHAPPKPHQLDAVNLHNRLYDRYRIELSDLQILVGRARDNWKYAHTKSTSTLHLLDRFSISLMAERRVVHTVDPQYPLAALCGSLPALVAHLSEHKLQALARVLTNTPLARRSSTPQTPTEEEEEEENSESSETERSEYSSHQNATLFVLQFAIDQMSLEVQSRGRSIAEVQVCGVRASLQARPGDCWLSLSVHSLLLVDALQTYGPDFELLVASHKHVGMDTASGSIRGSEPTSPTSPASPVSVNNDAVHHRALSSALQDLHHNYNVHDQGRTSPLPGWSTGFTWNTSTGPTQGGSWGNTGTAGWGNSSGGWGAAGVVDSEALIAVELCLVKGEGDSEDLRIANILFNNLDIIANQETIVELIGFGQRVMAATGDKRGGDTSGASHTPHDTHDAPTGVGGKREPRTEITFDFHRLGVLLLRSDVQEGAVVAKKIATATLGEAKIQATIDGASVSVSGSLGGVQVVSLCAGGPHARVLAAGRPARAARPAHCPAPGPAQHARAEPNEPAESDHHKALHFAISRNVAQDEDTPTRVVTVTVTVEVARVWYTQSAALLGELQSCLAQFTHYLRTLARSIREAARDLATTLVHPRGESLYATPKLSQSMEGVSPRRRTTSMGCSLDDPPDLGADNVILSVSILVESPVVVVPESASGPRVLVAHLGRMALSRAPAGGPERAQRDPGGPQRQEPAAHHYTLQLRDISLVTLDTSDKVPLAAAAAASMAELYDAARGQPVLHDTALQLHFTYQAPTSADQHAPHKVSIAGGVVGGLQVSLRREQYELILQAAAGLAPPQRDYHHHPHPTQVPPPTEPASVEAVEPAVPTLRLDPALRAAVLAAPPPAMAKPPRDIHLTVLFELSTLTVELRADLGAGERSLVQLACREFTLRYEKMHRHETLLQVSLHSITMEDLTAAPDSRHRLLLQSHSPPAPAKAVFLSKSCPDLRRINRLHYRGLSCSLPDHLNMVDGETRHSKRDSKCGLTPPCSPSLDGEDERELEDVEEEVEEDDESDEEEPAPGDNLVWLSVHTRDPGHPHFDDKYNKVRKLTKVDFNCLKLVVNIDSWVAVLDFFGVAGDEPPPPPDHHDGPLPQLTESESPTTEEGIVETVVRVRRVTVCVAGRDGAEVCGGAVRGVRVAVRGAGGAGGRGAGGAGGAGGRRVAGRVLAARLSDPRRRRLTTGRHTFLYHRLSPSEALEAGYETSLSIEMGPVTYVHTKRFILQLQAFARDFAKLRRVLTQARLKVSPPRSGRSHRLRLRVRCAAPVIVVPVSGAAAHALAATLTTLTLDNHFTTLPDHNIPDGIPVEVRTVRLEGVCVRAVGGGAIAPTHSARPAPPAPPLLSAPAHLVLTITHNLHHQHCIPDMSISGTLTTLQATLDSAQYRLVRGVLDHNLADDCTDLLPEPQSQAHPQHQVWTTMSLKLELHDVTVRLEPDPGSPLACINFIKSRLVVETFSDLSQDIDLVSQEILVSDTRYVNEPANRRGNVFTHIVQPMADHRHSVQAEVHARKRRDSSAYTILVNNMRLMAILDWWEAAHHFITQPPLPPWDTDLPPIEERMYLGPRAGPPSGPPTGPPAAPADHQTELKLNITDSQIVLVEDASLWDTNAVILKSTTVVRYCRRDMSRPVWCELSELEVFSCVLGLEDETALAIVQPAALTAALSPQGLRITMGTLNLRLSYHDMRMFAAMLQSLPAQARAALSGNSSETVPDAPANSSHMRARAGAGGGAGTPRSAALGLPINTVGPPGARAALASKFYTGWGGARPHPPAPPPPPAPPAQPHGMWPLQAVEVSAECITLCVIDDCLDSDVPLLEVALSDVRARQASPASAASPVSPASPVRPVSPVGPVSPVSPSPASPAAGSVVATLAADYYNRMLSGWEPIIEPWKFEARWENTLTDELSMGRLQVEVTSEEVLNTIVTSSLIELCQLVKKNWTTDYYAPQTSTGSPKSSPAGHRRRSPFVPYALRNHTGQRLWFTTLITTCDVLQEQTAWSSPDDSWVMVRGGDTEPFSFGRGGGRGGRGAGGGAGAALRQLALRLDQWEPPDPVCVDRVGVFFRKLTHTKSGAEAWLVLEVSLEGSARKLVTVRSALQLVNKLPHAVEVRVEHASPSVQWSAASAGLAGAGVGTGAGRSRGWAVGAGARWAAPLAARAGALWVRPAVPPGPTHAPAPPPAPAELDWRAGGLLSAECRAAAPYRFCCCVVREPFPPDAGPALPAHTLTLVPALRLDNLLPLELHYRAAQADDAAHPRAQGTLAPADTRPFHEVNVDEGVELSIKLEGFGWSSSVFVGGAGAAGGGSFAARLKLRDLRGRRLYLNARVSTTNTDGIKVSISAEYWVVNRTGLPLVFRGCGAAGEAAGQFEEHEVARMVAPLLFSFAEADGGPTLAARLGRGIANQPEWCSPFGLGPGVCVKRLVARPTGGGGGGAGGGGGGGGGGAEGRVFACGVWTRAGRGRYRHTNIVTLTPRYHIHNNTHYHLQFAQTCTATTVNDPGALSTYVTAMPGCHLPWHWARWDKEHLLSVRVLDAEPPSGAAGAPRPARAPRTAWSGGWRVDAARSLHVACREDGSSSYQLLRVEVVSQSCSLFVVVSPGDSGPPPLRLENYSPVAIMFHQVGVNEECVLGSGCSMWWALPACEGPPALSLRAPGGPRLALQLGERRGHDLLYQNFIYVAFPASATSDTVISANMKGNSTGPEDDGVLVLEVPLNSTRVILARKRYGDRCQLWRRGPNDQLIHEGSSPPQPTDALLTDDNLLSPHAMVLDIEEAAPRPGRASQLVLRRLDPRRASTQAWRLAPGPGGARMACAHANLYVQPLGGLMALTPGSRVVLGLSPNLAPEQLVCWQTLRPGSGRLRVTLSDEGPTSLIRITDHAAPKTSWNDDDYEFGAERSGGGSYCREWSVSVSIAGVSVSLLLAPAGEVLHCVARGLRAACGQRAAAASLQLAVADMQWDNQLLGSPCPVLLHCLPGAAPALHVSADLLRAPARRYNAYFFRHLIVTLKPLAIRLEERLILRLWWWWCWSSMQESREQVEEAEAEARRLLRDLTALNAPRAHFTLIKLVVSQIRLSMMTSSKLEPELVVARRRLGLTLIKFEDAAVELEPFVRTRRTDTPASLARQLLDHFKDELKWQAAKILGSVDFLGNPLGFVADVSEGVSGLLLEGNVGALLKNVTHGISNSAAKVTESLGDGLERVVGDEAHEETRRRIRSAAAGAHLAAGFRGLSLGILGGMTSLVKHSYEGATTEGLQGFLAGVGKGLVGTVTKPVIGVLDLAAETASALRDHSRRSDKVSPGRMRAPRLSAGADGLVPRYCGAAALGAALLHALNSHDYTERYLDYRCVRHKPHDIRALLSHTHLRIFTCKHAAPQVVMETHLSNLVSCCAVTVEGAHFVELGVRGACGAGEGGAGAGQGAAGGAGGAGPAGGVRRPRVQTDTAELAAWLAAAAAYARRLYHEHEHTLRTTIEDNGDAY